MYLRLHITNGAQINNPTNTIRYGGLRTGVHLRRKVNDPNTTPIKQDVVKYKIRASIDNFYDIQKLRIQCGNRICAAIRQTDDETENDNILKTLASEYNRVTDVLAEKYKSSRRSLGKAIKATDDLEIIKSEIDYNMAEQYVALLNQEQQVHLKAG